MTTIHPPGATVRLTEADQPIRTAKTPTEILDSLGLPHSEALLSAVQATCDDHAAIRQQIKGRIQKIMGNFDHLQGNVRKLGADNIAELARMQVEASAELKKTKESLLATQKALAAAMKELTPAATDKVYGVHYQAMNRADAAARKDYQRSIVNPRFLSDPAKKPRGPNF